MSVHVVKRNCFSLDLYRGQPRQRVHLSRTRLKYLFSADWVGADIPVCPPYSLIPMCVAEGRQPRCDSHFCEDDPPLDFPQFEF